ncbi:MIP/aquaporin family protein [Methanorbis rubei]|uniref:Glycerol uptake facilitator protein n=1 Tax=Methanorbis rubei TaxID=3028300 RepID=A0AAE4MHF7_9EURY|nr:Glycerol uptake facilitator protein [Methanocorpusculaceae archaeon Cs1]
MELVKRSIAELVGTMLLVFIGCGAVSVLLMLAAGTPTATPFDIGIGALGGLGDWLAVGVAFGIAVAVVIYTLGRVSGAHINPAVSIALWSIKKFPAKDTVAYIIAQCIGAAIGSALFLFIAGPDALAIGGLGATAPFPGISIWQVLVAEIIGTFVLMLTIMGVAVDQRATPGFAGLVIGMAVAGVIIAIGNISGGSLNPARTFGPDLIATIMGGSTALVTTFPIYVVGPIVGAVLAAFFYKYVAGLDNN